MKIWAIIFSLLAMNGAIAMPTKKRKLTYLREQVGTIIELSQYISDDDLRARIELALENITMVTERGVIPDAEIQDIGFEVER